jgi:uncharacterized repeat protein (TIGR01451 family)
MGSPSLAACRKAAGLHIACVALLPVLALTTPGAGARQVEHELVLPGLEVSTDVAGERTWTDLSLPGTMPEVAVGDPSIPSLRVTLPIDRGHTVTGYRLVVLADEVRELRHPVRPYGGEQSSRDDAPPSAEPNLATYASSEPFPRAQVELVREFELSDGARYATFRVHPLQYNAVAGQLYWIQRARLVADLQPAQSARPALRQSSSLTREREPLGRAAGAPSDGGLVLLSEAGFAPSDAPSANGSLVEYVIVSPDDEDMVTAWQRLADWKTASGHPAVVRTTSWIASEYPTGSDLGESIRMFLQDCYTHWGLRWALLGGDTDRVPCRYVRSWFYNPQNITDGTDVACDLYYACLENTWDYDADGVFGEAFRGETQTGGPQAGDKNDYSPEIHVGRISAHSAQEVENYLDKYFIYTQTPSGIFLDRMLLLGEVLFHSQWLTTGLNGGPDCDTGEENCTLPPCRVDDVGTVICSWYDGATDCFQVEDKVLDSGVGIDLTMLLERYYHWRVTPHDERLHPDAQPETYASVLQEISAGYGIVQHVGHGDRDRWAVGEGRLMLSDIPLLTNGTNGRFFLCYGVNCSSAAIDYDSFGEEMLLVPGQGAVAYIGCTNVDFPSSADVFTTEFYRVLFEEPGRTVGDAYFASEAANAPEAGWEADNVNRFLATTMVLLGEPGMVVWQGTPGDLDLSFNASPSLGAQEFVVTVTSNGSPVAGASVCVQKLDEVYVVAQTGANGAVTIPFWPQTTGAFQVTATSGQHRPAMEEGTVGTGTGSQLVLEDFVIYDDGTHGSSGNGNGRIEVGETIRLAVPVRNAGNQTAQSVNVTLSLDEGAPSGLLSITDATAQPGGGVINAGTTATDNEGFLLAVASDPPEAAFDGAGSVTVAFGLDIASSAGSHSGTAYLDATRPLLGIGINRSEDVAPPPAGRRNLYLGLVNTGKGTASGCTATLVRATQIEYVTVITSQVPMDDLEPGAEVQVGPFLISVAGVAQARLQFEVEDAAGNVLHTRVLDLLAPTDPDSLTAIGMPGAVNLSWDVATDPSLENILGYKVVRALEGSGNFEDAHEGVLTEHRYLNDSPLDLLTQYSYKVAAVDAGGNLGSYTDPVEVYTSPGMATGWPARLGTPTPASPMICELDGWYGTGREIVFSAEDIYAYHGTGVEVTDGDNVGSTMGIYSSRGPLFWGKAAAGDINADGRVDLLAVSKATAEGNGDSLYCWQGDTGKAPAWAIKLQNNISWTTPVLANLDNSPDGRLEIILLAGKAGGGGVYVFQYNGTRAANTDIHGLLVDMDGAYLYQKPSVGDIDGDGRLEIVAVIRDLVEPRKDGYLWVVEANGTPLTYFNGWRFSSATMNLGNNQGTTSSPTIGNVDGGSDEEIFIVTPEYLAAFKYNRDTPLWTKRMDARYAFESTPEAPLGDIDGDGDLDLAVVDATGRLWVLDARTGSFLSGFSQLHAPKGASLRYSSCILANVDDDPRPEIIFGDNDRYVYAYTHEAQPARGFPVFVGGKMFQQSLAAWDVDNDGNQNLVVQANNTQQLVTLDLAGVAFDPRHNPWPMRYRDDRNSGRYVPISVDANWPVAIQMSMADPVVSAQGSVRLEWSTAEPVLMFRVHRGLDGAQDEALIGEVPGRSGPATQAYVFEDTPPGPGVYRYRIAPVSSGGVEELGATVLAEIGTARPLALQLRSVFPNPLRAGRSGGSQIVFAVPGRTGALVDVRLRVIDLQGRAVRTLLQEARVPGVHTAGWDGRDDAGVLLPSGLYLLSLDAGGAADSQRMLIIR